MHIAYLIMIHKNLEQFQRLFRALYDPRDCYLVHADRKSDSAFHQAVADFLRGYANAYKMDRLSVIWAGWSVVEVHLRAMSDLLRLSGDWSYLINLSGQDFPLQPTDEIRALLAQSADRNYIDARDLETEWPQALKRVQYYWVPIPGLRFRPIRLPIRRRFPRGARPYGGSNWCILGRPFCEWLVAAPEVERFRRFYKLSVCADEGFLQTVIMHSPFRETIVRENYRAIVWTGKKNPKTLTCDDLDALLSSGKMFARKFDPAVDERVIDELERRILTASANTTGHQ